MKVSDLLAPELEGVSRVVLGRGGRVDVRSLLRAPDDVKTVSSEKVKPGSIGDGVLVTVVGPDRAVHGDADAALAVLDRLSPGGRAILLLGYADTELPVERLVGPLVASRCRIRRLAAVTHATIHAVALVDCVDELRDDHGAVAGDGLEVALDLANGRTINEFVADRLRTRLQDSPADMTPEPALRKLVELEAELARAQARIAMLEGSTSLRVGRIVVGAAKSPRSVVRLPVDLLRLARRRAGVAPSGPRRRGGRKGGGASAVAALEASALGPETRRFLANSSVVIGSRTRFSIAGILRPTTAAALTPDADVNLLLPHDALLILERVEPDIVLIETAAFRAGLPWAFTGDPVATERDRGLIEILEMARILGRPTVLWRNTPDYEAIGLVQLESRFDQVLPEAGPLPDWSIGVQLARANPIGLADHRPTEPLLVGRWDARAPVVASRRLEEALGAIPDLTILEDIEGAGSSRLPETLGSMVRGQVDPARAIATYRRHAVFVADPFPVHRGTGVPSGLLEQIACGARVASLTVDAERLAGLGPLAVPTSTEELAGAIAGARSAGPSSEVERRHVLRALYRQHAVPVMLEALRRRLVLNAQAAGSRTVAVLAAPSSDAEADALIDDLLLQEDRPTEVLISGPLMADGGERIVSALARASMPARPAASPSDAAASTETTWLWPWRPGLRVEPTTMLDLLVGAECSRADVIGLTDEPTGLGVGLRPGPILLRRQVFLETLPVGDDAAEGPLEAWRTSAARTFGLAALAAPVPA